MLVAETNFLKYEVDLTYNQFDFQCTVKPTVERGIKRYNSNYISLVSKVTESSLELIYTVKPALKGTSISHHCL